jgi:hypothetical protein
MINKHTINTWYEDGQNSKAKVNLNFPLFSSKRHSTFNEEALEDAHITLLGNIAYDQKNKIN